MFSRRATTSRFERFLWVVALLSLGFCSWSWLDSHVYQIVQGRRLDGILEKKPAVPATLLENGVAVATRAEVETSGLLGRIEIPRLGVVAMVAEGINARTLRRAAGHVPGTAFPGEPGNVAIAGHRDSFFSGLREAQRGDQVWLFTPDGKFEYRVDSIRLVRPDQTEVLSASDAPMLTLITCFPFHYVGAAPERFIVRARPVGRSSHG